MSNKKAAAWHEADVVDRLMAEAHYSDDGQLMRQAADTIRDLRTKAVVVDDETVERVARAIHAEYRKTDPGIHRSGWDEIDPRARENWIAEARAALSALTGATP